MSIVRVSSIVREKTNFVWTDALLQIYERHTKFDNFGTTSMNSPPFMCRRVFHSTICGGKYLKQKHEGTSIQYLFYEGKVIGIAQRVMEDNYKGKSKKFKLEVLQRIFENPALILASRCYTCDRIV